MKISDYPNSKSEARKKFFRQMKKHAYPQGWEKEMSFEEFIKRMKRGG